MRILHILSHSIIKREKEFTGADRYTLTLADEQIRNGNRVFIIGDYLAGKTPARFFPRRIGRRRFYHRITNILYVKRLIEKHGIDIVHAHSRAASWVGFFAIIGKKIPLVSTIHGRQKLHFSTRAFDIYGDLIIAVCENLRQHLVEELCLEPWKIEVIPNGFSFRDFEPGPEKLRHPEENGALAGLPPPPSWGSEPASKSKSRIFSIIGRTTGEKGNKTSALVKNVIPVIKKQFPGIRFAHIGGNPSHLDIDRMESGFRETLTFEGYVPDVKPFIKKSDVVVGSGRVAIEALSCGVPTIALGESCCHGLVSPENFEAALKSNFGDILPEKLVRPIDYGKLTDELLKFLTDPPVPETLKERIRERFDIRTVGRQIEKEYRRAVFLKNFRHFPILLYHRVVRSVPATRHRIYVLEEEFIRQMRFLKNRGFTPITFGFYYGVLDGRIPLAEFPRRPVIITFDDGYLDNYEVAFPILKKFDFSAVIFAIGDPEVRSNIWDEKTGEQSQPLLSPGQMREMSEWGIEFGAHSLSHPDLTAIPPGEAEREIERSRDNLEKLLGKPVISFAYPYGRKNEKVKDIVRNSGMCYGLSTDSGGMFIEQDPFEIFRTHIFPRDRTWEFFKKTSPLYRHYIRWKRQT